MSMSLAEPLVVPTARRLDAAAVEAYGRDGLIMAPVRIAPDLLERMRASLDTLLLNCAGIAPESLVCPHIPDGARHPASEASAWFDYATLPPILDLVEQILGPDVILWGSQVFCKPAQVGREVPWHQDGEYWPIRPLATCSVWIALDPATPENGCMRYLPGSHAVGSAYPHRDSARPRAGARDRTRQLRCGDRPR